MDVQKEIEKFLLEWDSLEKNEINKKIELQITKFKNEKNKKIFLKVLLDNLKKRINKIISDMNEDTLSDNKIYILKLKEESEKIECLSTIYDEFKKTYKEEKKVISNIKINNNIIITSPKIVLKKSFSDIDESDDFDYNLPKAIEEFSIFVRDAIMEEDSQTLIKDSDYYCNELVEYLFYKKTLFIELNHLLDTIKVKINMYEKDTKERKILKEIQKKFKNIYKIYNNEVKVKTKQDVYFEIIDYYLDNENYFSIQELIEKKPEIRGIYNSDGHIVLHILKKYIENFQKMTKNKNSEYINVEFLKDVYDLFTRSPKLSINLESKQTIDETIDEFCTYIKTTLIKRSRKNFALNEAKSMKSNNFYYSKIPCDLYEFKESRLEYESSRISMHLNNCLEQRKNCQKENAFIIGNRAYTIVINNASIILKMHSLDISSYVPRNTILSCYLEQIELNKEKINIDTFKELKFEENREYPVITYSLEFFKSGKLKNLEIDKNVINITNSYNNIYNKNEEQTEFFDLYKKSVYKNGGLLTTFDIYKMNQHFEDLLGSIYIDFIKENKYPYIYYGYRKQTDTELVKMQSFLATKLNDLDKSTTKNLIHILTSKIDRFHYSKFPIVNPIYNLKIVDVLSFLGLENQRMLNDLYFNLKHAENSDKRLKIKKEYKEYYEDKIEQLNESINYIDMENVKENRGKMKIKRRSY